MSMRKCVRCGTLTPGYLWALRWYCAGCYAHDRAIASKVRPFVTRLTKIGECGIGGAKVRQ